MQAWVEATEQSTAYFTHAGDQRQRCAELANVGFGYMELGLFTEAERVLRDALDVSERLGQATTKHVVGHHLGFVFGVLGKADEGAQLLTLALAHAVETQNLQLATSSRTYLALVALERRDLAAALTWAQATLDHADLGDPRARLGPRGLRRGAPRARDDRRGRGRRADSVDAPRVALRLGDPRHHRLPHVRGGRPQARARGPCPRGHRQAYEKIMVAAFKIKRSDWSRSYLGNVREHARTHALARAWGVAG